jgi:hypothetical protein
MSQEKTPEPPGGELVLFQTEDFQTRVEVRIDGGTVWLTQAQMADLFQKDVRTINEHLGNIFEEGELNREATIRKFRIVRMEGSREVAREVEHYRLEAILAVGYRVRSPRGTLFRQWATTRLEEYLRKGFVLDDERLKNPGPGRPDYFDELLARIRDIRASEKRVYLKLRELFTLAVDYDAQAESTQHFYQVIQNKLHWAATGQTAAELIRARADAAQPNMGLTSWSGAKVRKQDVTVAKNYLNTREIDELNRIVVMYLDYAEDQAKRRRQLWMKDWLERLDAFLKFNEREVLGDAGSVAKELADRHAEHQYEQFHARRLATEAEAEEKALDEALKKLPKPRKRKG